MERTYLEKRIPPLASKQLEQLLTPINDIKPHPDNYKTHPPEQITALRASLKAFGCTAPIKANLEGFIVAGHGMYQLYLEDGYTHVPVLYEALDKQLSKAYLVADNETARKAVTDSDALGKLLSDAAEIPDFDIESVGFSIEDVDSLFSYITTEEQEVKDLSNVCGNVWEVVISCNSEEEQEAAYNKLVTEGYNCRVLIL